MPITEITIRNISTSPIKISRKVGDYFVLTSDDESPEIVFDIDVVDLLIAALTALKSDWKSKLAEEQ